MSTKTIHIKLVTPWGVSLMHKELKNWKDVDINRFMELHYISVRTSKDNYISNCRFNIIPLNKKGQTKKQSIIEKLESIQIDLEEYLQQGRKEGKPKGHAIRSIIDCIYEKTEFFKNYC